MRNLHIYDFCSDMKLEKATVRQEKRETNFYLQLYEMFYQCLNVVAIIHVSNIVLHLRNEVVRIWNCSNTYDNRVILSRRAISDILSKVWSKSCDTCLEIKIKHSRNQILFSFQHYSFKFYCFQSDFTPIGVFRMAKNDIVNEKFPDHVNSSEHILDSNETVKTTHTMITTIWIRIGGICFVISVDI